MSGDPLPQVFRVRPDRASGDVLVLEVDSDLDLVVHDLAFLELERWCTQSSASTVAIGFGDEVFVDLRGLDVLLVAAGLARSRGRRLLVVRPPRSLRRMVEVLGLRQDLALVASWGEVGTGWSSSAERTEGRHDGPVVGSASE